MIQARPFLTAEWRYLAMLNFEVPRVLLEPHVPAGTVLDDWEGRTYLSLVGFLFRDTRLKGVPVPGHRHFEELNLRFYVRRKVAGEVRRGVTFLKELVPRRVVALVARLTYNEPYEARPMRHRLGPLQPEGSLPAVVEYGWHEGRDRWGRLVVAPAGPPESLVRGSEAEFITAHYWGYTRQRDGGTIEYRVEHPPWQVAPVHTALVEGNLTALYGPDLAEVLQRRPTSAFLAAGSRVTVFTPSRIPPAADVRRRVVA